MHGSYFTRRREKIVNSKMLCAVIVAVAAANTPVMAQVPGAPTPADTEGFQIGLGLNGSAIQSDDLSDETESGGGLFFRIGYGFTPSLTVFAGGAGASMNDGEYGLGQFDLGLRLHFPRGSSWVPFVEGAVTGRALVIDSSDLGTQDDLEVSGIGFTGGGGLDYYLNRSLSLGVELAWTFGDFTDAKMGGESVDLGDESFGATTSRFNLGLTWWP